MTLMQALTGCADTSLISDDPVCSTIVNALADHPASAVDPAHSGVLRIGVGPVTGVEIPEGEWACVRVVDGDCQLSASTPSLLYGLYTRIRDAWGDEPASNFSGSRWLRPTFTWLTGRDELLTGRYGFLRQRTQPIGPDDVDASMQELARLGCTHVVINELARRSFEAAPKGEVYYRFYDYTPDIDQYVETRLNVGTYPREYLGANLDLLRRVAETAEKYGLIPGLYSAHPRSVPESLLERWPHLRGARIDHTFRSYLPRYTLSVAHPAVRWHYAELMRTLLREVPQLGFIKMLLNDSGSGFEYTSSLYAGRNGGPYVVREWRPDAEIARLAAENVIRYYRMLRDAAQEVNPTFQLMTGLKNIAEEQTPILAGMDSGINLQTQSQRSDVDDAEWQQTRSELEARGAHVLSDTNATGANYILGMPSPWWTAQRLSEQIDQGYERIDVYLNASYFAPFDPNREIVGAMQLDGATDVDSIVATAAKRWTATSTEAETLTQVWRWADEAARQAPCHFLYSWLGFTWYRWWVRPFVPNLSAIPARERAYYEEPMLTLFNNPHNIDFAADALWNLQPVDEADASVKIYDTDVATPLARAIDAATQQAESGVRIWIDLRDRLRAYKCYVETLRNLSAWIGGVHGYVEATDPAERNRRRQQVDEMVRRERANAADLLDLWRASDVDFMPLQTPGESVHNYGMNFDDQVERKIALMDAYGDREPRIDRDFMFRAPEGFPVDEEEYLKY